ncbi:MAG: hypothetical protein LBS35_06495 [Synergistaceae bacterium]|jgi:hypothetical protein|nr:hypothetical protein [Synergistaceae bacterium]
MPDSTHEGLMMPMDADLSPLQFGGGDGLSPETAYIISKAEHLLKLARDVNGGMSYGGSYFRITDDIDLGGMSWRPVGYCTGPFDKREFCGVFDGAGHTVKGFVVENQGKRSAGLFGYIEYAVIQNLYVEDFEMKGGDSIGGVAGYAETSSIVSCYVEGKISPVSSSNIGGIVGIASSSVIENSVSNVFSDVRGANACGGMCGYVYSGTEIANCEARGALRAADSDGAGGFVGIARDSSMKNCHSKVSLDCAECAHAGGFGGYIRGCRADWCTAHMDVVSNNERAGSAIGGFAGLTSGLLTRCAAAGAVNKTGTKGAAGGFAGDIAGGSIFACYASGGVTGEGTVGGFAGSMECGEGSATVENCYCLGSVTSSEKGSRSGGFVGVMSRRGGDPVVMRCYSFGELSPLVKGFTVKQSAGSIVDCVWRRDELAFNSKCDDGRGIQELSTERFGDRGFFAGINWSIFDDEGVWRYLDEITPRRPHLNGVPLL